MALQKQMGTESRKHKIVENARTARRLVQGVYPGIEHTVVADEKGLLTAPSPIAIPSAA